MCNVIWVPAGKASRVVNKSPSSLIEREKMRVCVSLPRQKWVQTLSGRANRSTSQHWNRTYGSGAAEAPRPPESFIYSMYLVIRSNALRRATQWGISHYRNKPLEIPR